MSDLCLTRHYVNFAVSIAENGSGKLPGVVVLDNTALESARMLSFTGESLTKKDHYSVCFNVIENLKLNP